MKYISINKTDREVCISFHEEITIHSLPYIKEEMSNNISFDKDVSVSLKNVSYIDSSGIGFFMMLYKQHTKNGNKFYIKDMSHSIESILKLTSLYNIFVRENKHE